ncbi:MAG TPA: tripartite tricarboxylate transporter substrate binding protein [Burkholderiaceae bacterium]|nr:tripartite tricarboxylate transporter substrate binding protein [Burkholderiaceae bacterium]
MTGPDSAQTWPGKPVTIVVPFPAGGTTDVLARAVGQELAKVLGQPVVVDNKPGAGATVGAAQVANAKPDGHTLLMGAVHHTIATSVYKKLPYDYGKDFAPITTVALVPNVLVVGASVPASNAQELIAYAKANPGKLAYGSNGSGTLQHLIGAQFSSQAGVDILHVPYKGSGPLVNDLLGGQVAMSFDTITPVLAHIKAGKLKALAVTTSKRSSTLPNVPTLDESGLKGFNMGTWFGLLAPAATPKEIVARLNTEVVKIIKTPEFRKRLEEIGAEPVGNTTEQMAQQIRDDTATYAKVVKEQKVTIE